MHLQPVPPDSTISPKYNNRVNPATNYPPATEPTDTGKSLLFRNSQAVSLCNFDSKTKTRRLLNSFTVWTQTGSFCFSVGVTLVGSIWFDCCPGIWNYYVLDMWWIHAFVSGTSWIKQLQMWFCMWNLLWPLIFKRTGIASICATQKYLFKFSEWQFIINPQRSLSLRSSVIVSYLVCVMCMQRLYKRRPRNREQIPEDRWKKRTPLSM